MEDKRILLHTCCGPCATASIERLLDEGHSVVLYYANSNISPEKEYEKRLDNVRRLAEKLDLRLEVESYDHPAWLAWIKGLEEEPERGKRCGKCFEFNLSCTARAAERLGIPHFATTLTISPHKSSDTIFRIGEQFLAFLPLNFKKKDGFRRSLELSEAHDLYRQDYCGCEF